MDMGVCPVARRGARAGQGGAGAGVSGWLGGNSVACGALR